MSVTFLTNRDKDELQKQIDELENEIETSGSESNGSSDLPEVSEKDNGKILKVVNGKWTAAELPVFNGEYLVTPSTEEVMLLTAQKIMDANVKVEKIPYTEVSNESGGVTANIG